MRARIPKVCVAVTGTDASDLIEKSEALVRDNHLLEFRLDYLKTPASAIPRLKRFLDLHPEVIGIATCRRAVNGGKFRGSAAVQLDLLIKAADAGCQIVDIELESATSLKPSEMDKLRQRVAVLLSYHDFKGTKKLDETFAKMKAIPGRVLQTGNDRDEPARQRRDDEVPAGESRPVFVDRPVHGRAGHHQPRAGSAGGKRVHFRFVGCGRRDCSRTGHGARTARHLSHRYGGRGYQGLWRCRRSGLALAVSGHDEFGVPSRKRECRLRGAAREEACGSAGLRAGHSDPWSQRDDAVQAGDRCRTGQQRSADAKDGACNTVVRAQDGRLYGFNTDVLRRVGSARTAHESAGRESCWCLVPEARHGQRSSD